MLTTRSLVVAATAVLASAVAVAMPVVVRVPVAREHGKADPTEAGVFSHWQHDEFSCTVCHPTIFPKSRVGFTHDDMDEGKFCGACHNGQSAPPASGERAACRSTCHAK
jgi:c(7)-type cytochrome triheme protein